MSLLIDAAVRSSILLALGLAIHAMLRGRSAALRHAVVGTSIVFGGGRRAAEPGAAVLDCAGARPRRRPGEALPAARERRASTAAARAGADPVGHGRASSRQPGLGTRISGARPGLGDRRGVLLVMLAVRTARMMRMSARARPLADERIAGAANRLARIAGVRGRIAILESDAPDLIATWGVRPRILLPPHASRWSDERLNAVLCHEIAHVRRRDWVVQMAADVGTMGAGPGATP